MEQTMLILMTFSRVLENTFFRIDALFPVS
jgi:hypothetical protein